MNSTQELENIKNYLSDVAGAWNGEDAGIKEERANCALEGIEKIKELKEILEEL